jgi:hypothetical protein
VPVVIQNAPGETGWPVRPRNRYRRLVAQARTARNPTRAALRSTALIGPGFTIAMGLLFTQAAWTSLLPSPFDSLEAVIAPLLLLIIFIIIAPPLIASVVDADLPLREQQRYASGSTPITERQQQILALDAISDYTIKGWNSSLEYWPAGVRLRPPVLDSNPTSPFLTMSLIDPAGVRSELDQRYRVLNEQTLQLFIADALAERSASAGLLRVLRGPDADSAVACLAALSGTDEWDIRARAEARDGRPPLLMWALDTQRIMAAIRMSYVAGYIVEPHAWELLERIADIAFSLHAGWAEYHQSLVIGAAFASDSLDEVERVRNSIRGLTSDGWPAARVAYGSGTGRLPDQILSPSDRLLPNGRGEDD